MNTHTPRRNKVRSSIAVFHHTGDDYVIVRGIGGTEVLGRHKTLREASEACSKYNQQLAKELGA
jgi:ribosomal protein S24E